MANRHTHKKLRTEIRARREATGESYQQARARILSRAVAAKRVSTDLVPFSYFGVSGTLATFESHGLALFAFVPSSTSWENSHPLPLPLLRGSSLARGLQ